MDLNYYANNAGRFISNQLSTAGVSLEALGDLLSVAGGGMSIRWLQRLIDNQVNKVTIRQLIGLRRLFNAPIDTIIGLEYLQPDNQAKMAGLKRIAAEFGGKYKKACLKRLCDDGDCAAVIISRIKAFSAWSVLHRAADIETSAESVKQQLRDTFSLPVLIRLRYALHANIDDILGLGDYDVEAEYLATATTASKSERTEWTEDDEKRKQKEDAARIAFINRNKSSQTPQQSGDTLTGFIPAGE